MRRFEGKRVIITGGANGIGKATVARFAAEGAAIVLTDVNGSAAEAAARQIADETGATSIPSPPMCRSRRMIWPLSGSRWTRWAAWTFW